MDVSNAESLFSVSRSAAVRFACMVAICSSNDDFALAKAVSYCV